MSLVYRHCKYNNIYLSAMHSNFTSTFSDSYPAYERAFDAIKFRSLYTVSFAFSPITQSRRFCRAENQRIAVIGAFGHVQSRLSVSFDETKKPADGALGERRLRDVMVAVGAAVAVYCTSMKREAFCFSSSVCLGRVMVRIPSLTEADMRSRSTPSGRLRVCLNLV